MELADLGRLLMRLSDEFPEMQRELHTRLAETLEQELHSSIAATVNDTHGRIQGFQTRAVGSGGGYAAVRPRPGMNGANSPGAITQYLDGGHITRRPSGTAKRYRPRAKTAFVSGRHFYLRARTGAQRLLQREAESVARKYADKLRG